MGCDWGLEVMDWMNEGNICSKGRTVGLKSDPADCREWSSSFRRI